MKLKQFINEKVFKNATEKYSSIELIQRKYGFKKIEKNSDGTYDIWGNFEGDPNEIYYKFKINKFYGSFNCFQNELTTLRGSPKEVYGDYIISENELKSLKYCPTIVTGTFDCSFNELETLENCPKTVGKNFIFEENFVTTFRYIPSIIKGDFVCSGNKFSSLEFAPKVVERNWIMRENHVWQRFEEDDIRKVCNVKKKVIL